MSGRDAVDPAAMGWERVWALFDRSEQREILGAYWDACTAGEADRGVSDWILDRLAKALNHRRNRLLTATRERMIQDLHLRAVKLFDADCWEEIYRIYYPRRKRDLMCRFLDSLGIEHNDRGLIEGDWNPPTPDEVRDAVAALLKSFAAREVGRYLVILFKVDNRWEGVAAEASRLTASVAEEAAIPADTTDSPVPDPHGASFEFTTLDKVVIREVVRSITNVEGALDADELEDLVETVIELNESRQRTYFHLGLMDALSPERTPDFDRPALNDTRRWWYLAGIVAGAARTRDAELLRSIISSRSVELARAAAVPGGAGGAMAKIGFQFLAESGHLSEAAALLRGQLGAVGMAVAESALTLATAHLRQNEFGSARIFIDILRNQGSGISGDPEVLASFLQKVERRWGQCLQATGDFEGAERAFKGLSKSGATELSPDLLADLGLVKGRFRSLGDVRLPESQEQRTNLRDALTSGEPYFRQAVDTSGVAAPKACYALAMLSYLRYSLTPPTNPKREVLRTEALDRVRDAVTGIHQSEAARAYEDLGVLGQARFIQATLQMCSLDPVDGRAAMEAWRGITDNAGRFPSVELRALVEAAEAFDVEMAIEIAESIWKHRAEDAPGILAGRTLVSGSRVLRERMLALARQENLPRSRKMELWCSLVPGLIRENELDAAEEGLDVLEALADEPSLTERLLRWFSETCNHDPVLTWSEAAWIRINLLRKLGRDEECGSELRQLFFRVRGERPFEAEQILQAFVDWRLNAASYCDLVVPLRAESAETERDASTRLASGEAVRILFVGGNEIQARYDDTVRGDLRREWPGVEVVFEHSAWSSNWGRDVPRLLKAASEADAVVLMPLMRTMLGRTLRAKIDRPWIPCTSTGKVGMLSSVRRAAFVVIEQRAKLRR